MSIHVQRVYEDGAGPRAGGGARFLVDRLWPRGKRKDALALDGWLREVAPSDRLRQWFKHDPSRWDEFVRRYDAELDAQPEAWEPLLDAASHGDVTLLFGAKDEEHNNAVALKQYLERKLGRRARSERRPGAAPPKRAAAAAARRKPSARRAKAAVSARAPSSRAAR